ncbi:hypothetical protein ASC93_07010 [Massilia sp. Root335]|nr:hypothetical protein ASC93_07010 [Massilia sp. Root335]
MLLDAQARVGLRENEKVWPRRIANAILLDHSVREWSFPAGAGCEDVRLAPKSGRRFVERPVDHAGCLRSSGTSRAPGNAAAAATRGVDADGASTV